MGQMLAGTVPLYNCILKQGKLEHLYLGNVGKILNKVEATTEKIYHVFCPMNFSKRWNRIIHLLSKKIAV